MIKRPIVPLACLLVIVCLQSYLYQTASCSDSNTRLLVIWLVTALAFLLGSFYVLFQHPSSYLKQRKWLLRAVLCIIVVFSFAGAFIVTLAVDWYNAGFSCIQF